MGSVRGKVGAVYIYLLLTVGQTKTASCRSHSNTRSSQLNLHCSNPKFQLLLIRL